MRIWDIRRGIQAIRGIEGMAEPDLWIQAEGIMAGNALYASLFEEDIHRLDLHALPASHREGPELLNVLRFTDLPTAAAIVGERSTLRALRSGSQGLQVPDRPCEVARLA